MHGIDLYGKSKLLFIVSGCQSYISFENVAKIFLVFIGLFITNFADGIFVVL
jgi:hypothetical protein